MRNLARDAVLGLTLDASTAWEKIPWSWLVDYFSNIGKYLAAHRNIVPAQCTQLYVCTHATNTINFGRSQSENLVVDAWNIVSESKARVPVSLITPAAHLGFLNESQMSIVASLLVLKK